MQQALFIELTEDTMCAHDKHELTYYPRPGFKAKPKLPAGTVLLVKEVWNNFYGSYYKCKTSLGDYDIPIEKAKNFSEKLQTSDEEKIQEMEKIYPINKEDVSEDDLRAYQQGLRCGAYKMAKWKQQQMIDRFEGFMQKGGIIDNYVKSYDNSEVDFLYKKFIEDVKQAMMEDEQ